MTQPSAVRADIAITALARYIPAAAKAPGCVAPTDSAAERARGWQIATAYPFEGEPGSAPGSLPPDADAQRTLRSMGACDRVVVSAGPESMSEMALKVGHALAARHPELAGSGFLAYCHAAIPEDLETSTGCYLKEALRLEAAVPFSVAQVHAAAFLTATRILADLGATEGGSDQALITTVDRWLTPLPRVVAPFSAFGDAATAALLSSRCGRGWAVLAVANATASALADPYATEMGDGEILERYAAGVRAVVDAAIEAAAVDPTDVGWIVPQGLSMRLLRTATEGNRLRRGRVFEGAAERYGFLSSSDTPVALSLLSEAGQCRPGDLVLIWSAGLGGSFAAAVLLAEDDPVAVYETGAAL